VLGDDSTDPSSADVPEDEVSPDETGYTDATKLNIATSIFLLITVLIALTICFEYGKESLMEATSKRMLVVLDVLFSEMTVLGFLSLITFTITQTHELDELSVRMFEDIDNEDEKTKLLTETLEIVHMDLFLVMIIFVLQTLSLMRLGGITEKNWAASDKSVGEMKELQEARNVLIEMNDTPLKWYQFKQQHRRHEAELLFEYASMKKEFCQGRDVCPPFKIFEQKHQLPINFDYAAYLGSCLSSFMAELIEMNVKTWFLLEFGLIFFYVLNIGTDNNHEVFLWIWLGLGYTVATVLWIIRNNARRCMHYHVNPADIPTAKNGFHSEAVFFFHHKAAQMPEFQDVKVHENADETTLLIPTTDGHDYSKLPLWCQLGKQITTWKPNRLQRWLYGPVPNRQNLIYPLKSHGPHINMYAIRIMLFMHALYMALNIVMFYKWAFEMYEDYHHAGFVIYFFLSLIPTGLVYL
jgi:hypothetical protein